jgi:peptide/nickel transport system permease protein
VRAYFVKRLLLLIPTLLLVSIIVFLMTRFIPGNAIDMIMAQMPSTETSSSDRAVIEHQLGLDVSIPVQYVRWLGGAIHGDFGKSLYSREPVLGQLLAALPVTLELSIIALIIGTLLGLTIGLLSAIRQDSWGDYVSRTFAILMLSIPGFFIGTLVMIYPSRWWGWSPPMELIKITTNIGGNLLMFVIPAAVLSFNFMGGIMRVTRTMMLEVLRQDYIRTAWAKGLRERVVILKHAARNALIPVFTVIGLQISVLLGGTVIIEQIFVLPGLGRLMFQALLTRDYPIISAINIFVALIVVVVNLFIDMTYSWLDPRVSYK